MATAGAVPCKAEPIVPEWAYQENCYSLWATIGAGSLCSRWSRQLFGPRQRRTGPGNRSFLFSAGFPAGTSRGRAGPCSEFVSECAPFEGGRRTRPTRFPDSATAVQKGTERPSDHGRDEKLNQRIMSAEFETLRVCPLPRCVCRDCIRPYVLLSNGKCAGGVPWIFWAHVV